jgi:hypothetical protein
MTGLRKRRRAAKREEIASSVQDDAERCRRDSERRDERTREISTAVRAALVIWEIVQTLIRERLLLGTGPGRLL